MPESDCYCAVCGACIREFRVGSNSDKGQRVRGKVLRNRAHAATRQAQGSPPDESVPESDEGSDICDDEHSWTLRRAYDPLVLKGHDTSWVTELVLVANDPRKRRAPRTFLCGTARFDDNGMCQGTYGGDKYGIADYDCEKIPLYDFDALFNEENGGPGTYPCHVPCLKILARAITGAMDFHQLDPYVLHRALHRLCGIELQALKLDYGDMSGRDQFWESYPGEEFSVVNPLEQIPAGGAFISDFILTEDRKNAGRSLASKTETTDAQQDPFCRLPTELIHHVTDHMDGQELIALNRASRSVWHATRSTSFWKRRLLREQAWLWDSPFSISSWKATDAQHAIDWEKLYMVLEKSTARGFGTKGGMMGLANRRRIWKVCGEISRVYWEVWPQRDELREADYLAERVPVPDGNRNYDDESESESDD